MNSWKQFFITTLASICLLMPAAALADEAAKWLRQKGHDVTAVICAGVDSPVYAAEQIDFVVVLDAL